MLIMGKKINSMKEASEYLIELSESSYGLFDIYYDEDTDFIDIFYGIYRKYSLYNIGQVYTFVNILFDDRETEDMIIDEYMEDEDDITDMVEQENYDQDDI